MNFISRSITSKVNWCLDNLLPPILRDARWLCRFIYGLDDGVNADEVINFKENLPDLSDHDIGRYYALRRNAKSVNRPTDLNEKCVEYILGFLGGKKLWNNISVLDAGGGRCYLARHVFECTKYPVTVLDFQRADIIPEGIEFVVGDIRQMPFEDKTFDITLCTHTLEHIREPKKAIAELLRVTKRQVIIVMPKQREYRYSNDLHINYCPYMYSFKEFIGIRDAIYSEIGGDFVCEVRITQ